MTGRRDGRTRLGHRARRGRRGFATAAAVVLLSSALAACGGDSGTELIWYTNPDTGGQAKLAEKCSTDDYTITTQVLPQDASQQRIQLVRRLAAGDTEIDLMSLDPPFTAEFAEAGYLADIPDGLEQKLTDQSFEGAVDAATWEDQMVVAPFWSNTQVLWYRKSFVEKTDLDVSQPVTWEQVIRAADENGGKVAVQANKYEGYAVWINALFEGAGGRLVEDVEQGADATVTVDSPAGEDAARVVEQLASSKAAPADLSVSNEGTAVATFGSDAGAFMVNWTFVWTAYGDDPVSKDIGFTRYPRTVEGEESAPPYGGIGLGVNAATESRSEAMSAVECITSPENQAFYANDSGNMPASAAGYDDPKLRETYGQDLLDLFQQSVEAAAPRTVSPYWSDISLSLQSTWHPPSSVDGQTPGQSADFMSQALQAERLL
ncbi:extracellular solute-binding protein [Nocardioides donggukensis]|uniref:Extracellular solute-binding protein n=1 Tax=Nocardioides donggukensis TaxID=2774019 RepID=A0A927Q0A0_9ACTN|nr:extracellular solute-binding protein [Nocardioides donggukensis]MBD8870375.1 extracellular solute-binding protein [Nocardioides donggukensis]